MGEKKMPMPVVFEKIEYSAGDSVGNPLLVQVTIQGLWPIEDLEFLGQLFVDPSTPAQEQADSHHKQQVEEIKQRLNIK